MITSNDKNDVLYIKGMEVLGALLLSVNSSLDDLVFENYSIKDCKCGDLLDAMFKELNFAIYYSEQDALNDDVSLADLVSAIKYSGIELSSDKVYGFVYDYEVGSISNVFAENSHSAVKYEMHEHILKVITDLYTDYISNDPEDHWYSAVVMFARMIDLKPSGSLI
jgi:hypothetical protein